MRKCFLGWIGFLLLSALGTPAKAASAPIPAPASFEETINALSTPDLLVKWMKKNLKFVEDEKLFGTADYWQTPEEFWRRKKGDCEDYALFAKRVLEYHGIEAYVVSFYGRGGFAHTLVIYKESDGYNIINEDRIYRYEASTLEDSLSRTHPDWTWGSIAEERRNRGWPVLSLENHSFSSLG